MTICAEAEEIVGIIETAATKLVESLRLSA